jgi:hypothetical protein
MLWTNQVCATMGFDYDVPRTTRRHTASCVANYPFKVRRVS